MSRPSNTQIDKAGGSLVENSSNGEAFNLINNWRSLHSLPLVRLRANIYQYFKKRKTANTTTQRLKRIPTIVNKITRMGTMNVSQMQDIGGLRVIVKDINEVYALYKKLSKTRSDFSFTEKRCDDYIKNPKTKDKKGGYAYRSLHIIYEFHSDDINYNKLKIELQIRTKLQHYWSTAVEVVDVIDKQSIKFGRGSDDWNEFFAIVSSIFTRKEGGELFCDHQNMTDVELEERLRGIESKIGVIKKLQGISQIQTIGSFAKSTSYALIVLNTETNQTNITEYDESNLDRAYEAYATIEQDILAGQQNAIALLASASEFAKLKEGYLAYFLDVKCFVRELENIINP